MESLREYSILVVDDDPSWRETVSQILESYDVVSASSASEALEIMLRRRGNPFDVAILDKRLVDSDIQDQSGLNLARNIKDLYPDCQIVILTGYSDVSSTREALVNIQVADLLEKYPSGGFRPETLRSTIAKLLFGSSQTNLDRVNPSEDCPSNPLRPITLLHLSDLHYGETHRFHCKDIRPHRDRSSLYKALRRSLRTSDKEPDILIVSGDLTQTAEFGEFDQALQLIESLLEDFDLPADRAVVVPGNHDVRWKPSIGSHEFSQYQGFYRLLYDEGMSRRPPFSRVEFYALDDKPPVAVIGLDSCVVEGPDTAGIGYVGTSQLDRVFAELEDKVGDVDCVKVAVLHHHLVPVNYLENIPEQDQNFSLVADAARILNRLQEQGFSLILHGHQHQPFCTQVHYALERGRLSSPMTIVGMGSAGVLPELAGNATTNYFGLVEISSTDDLLAQLSWYRAEVNEPEETFELDREFSVYL